MVDADRHIYATLVDACGLPQVGSGHLAAKGVCAPTGLARCDHPLRPADAELNCERAHGQRLRRVWRCRRRLPLRGDGRQASPEQIERQTEPAEHQQQ